jgi:hypothetical protein
MSRVVLPEEKATFSVALGSDAWDEEEEWDEDEEEEEVDDAPSDGREEGNSPN